MKVKMKTLMSGPEGSAFPGQVVELPAKEARDLVEAGYADEVRARKAETKPKPEQRPRQEDEAPETASFEPDEKAVRPRGRRKKVE